MRIDLRRLRPPELLALTAGLLLAVALFLPWYSVAGVREDGWRALSGPAIVAAFAALAALGLVLATATQRSAALPLVLAVATMLVALVAVVLLAVNAASLPGGATERCYGLWLALAGAVGVLVAGWASMRDERPLWGVAVAP